MRVWIERLLAAARDPWGFLRAHWRDLAVVLAAPTAFIAVTILLGVLGAPAFAALALGGLASGLAGFVVSWLLGGEKFSMKRLLIMSVVGVAISLVPLGALRGAGLVNPSLVGKVFGSTWAKLVAVKVIAKAEAVGIEVTAVKTAPEEAPERATTQEPESDGIVNRLGGSK